MAKFIKSMFLRFTGSVQFDSGLFGVGACDVHYTDSPYYFPTAEDAWRHDWQNIAGDFHGACVAFAKEHM